MHGSAASQRFSSRRQVAWLVLRWMAGLAVLFAFMIALAHGFREPLERLGRTFADEFGYAGLAFGTVLADGFNFPVPPQFYMLLAIASDMSQPRAFAAIMVASLGGGFTGYSLAGRLARIGFVARWLERSRPLAERAFSRFGVRATVIASILPVPYSLLCYLAGQQRMPPRLFLLFLVLRIPRLVAYYYLVRLGWSI